MKSILQSAIKHIEKAFDSGLLVSDEFEHALLLEEMARVKNEKTDADQLEDLMNDAA